MHMYEELAADFTEWFKARADHGEQIKEGTAGSSAYWQQLQIALTQGVNAINTAMHCATAVVRLSTSGAAILRITAGDSYVEARLISDSPARIEWRSGTGNTDRRWISRTLVSGDAGVVVYWEEYPSEDYVETPPTGLGHGLLRLLMSECRAAFGGQVNEIIYGPSRKPRRINRSISSKLDTLDDIHGSLMTIESNTDPFSGL